MKKKVFIRADGDVQMGLGHLVRCIALAQVLLTDFDIVFFCKSAPPGIEKQILKMNAGFSRIPSEEAFFNQLTGTEIVVLDNYVFNSNYQKQVKEKAAWLVCLDDLHNQEVYADLIINANPGIKEEDYVAQPYTKFALGPQYALFRPAFLAHSGTRKSSPGTDQLLICLGGSDAGNKTMEILETVAQQYKGLIHVVAGTAYLFLEALTAYVAQNRKPQIQVHFNIDENHMVQLMQQCGIAICAASNVSAEYLCVTEGKLLLLLTADNQKDWYRFAISNKLAAPFDYHYAEILNKFDTNSELQNSLFDAHHTNRLLALFKTYEC